MKTQSLQAINLTVLCLLIGSLTAARSPAAAFSSGSDGSYGPLNITSNTTLDLGGNGIFNCTTITVGSGATLTFNRNPLNTPVYLLATSNVVIDGSIDVSGKVGSNIPAFRGEGGPGGFDGGNPGLGPDVPPGAGYGPGGGKGGTDNAGEGVSAGAGSYASVAPAGSSGNKGATYGSPLLIPLAGGSGGGGSAGSPGTGGAGGGGALLVASNIRIDISATGTIVANGAFDGPRSGSAGAIRLVAPIIAGNGNLNAVTLGSWGGNGRIRIDTLDRNALRLASSPFASVGSFMTVFPSPLPRLDIIDAAGTAIPEGTGAPVTIQLPFGSTTNRTVTVQARHFNTQVPINVVLTPESGEPVIYPATIDNAASNPAQTIVNVTIPLNTVVTINAWTR